MCPSNPPMQRTRDRLIKWLGGVSLFESAKILDGNQGRLTRRVDDLEREVREQMKFIGALFEYLQIRPQRTFVQDYSQLPPEEFSTMEVIKAAPIKKGKKPPTT